MAGSIAALIPEFQPWARALVDAAGAAGLQPRVTSTLRSRAEQTRLYRRYLAGLSQFPAAPPGRSAHEYGYALDMVVSPLEASADVGAWWQEQGGVWHESDAIHYEYPGFDVSAISPLNFPQTVIGTLLTPLPVSIGVTFSEWILAHPELRPIVDQLVGYGFPVTEVWDMELKLLPTWLRKMLSF
jgi:hypothetical protein